MTLRRIDLNCDLGEDPARIADGRDIALLDLVTSANIACGGHAGDEATMRAVVRAAHTCGVKIGAHPGYPDRANFGRVEVPMAMPDLKTVIASQIALLARIARSEGAMLHHVKPHGALYHAAMTRADIARAFGDAAASVDPSLALVGLHGAPALDLWRSMGFSVIAEAFADRRYEADGSLRPRTLPDALITDPSAAARQALRWARRGAGTICIHSDTPDSLKIANAVRAALEGTRAY